MCLASFVCLNTMVQELEEVFLPQIVVHALEWNVLGFHTPVCTNKYCFIGNLKNGSLHQATGSLVHQYNHRYTAAVNLY